MVRNSDSPVFPAGHGGCGESMEQWWERASKQVVSVFGWEQRISLMLVGHHLLGTIHIAMPSLHPAGEVL